MENFYSTSKHINSAFLFHNFSLYFEQLVKDEHSKNSSSLFVPQRTNVSLSIALVICVCMCTQSWDSSVSEKELERFYSKQTYTKESFKWRKNPTSLYRSKKEECRSSSVELDAKALQSSTKAKTNAMGKPDI